MKSESKIDETTYMNVQLVSKYLHVAESMIYRWVRNAFLGKCEQIFAQMSPFNKALFRELVYHEEKIISKRLVLKDLFYRLLKPMTISKFGQEIIIRQPKMYLKPINLE